MNTQKYENIVNAIKTKIDPEKIILFGSRARGDNSENSDIDLLIIEKEPFNKERSRLKELARIRHAVKDTNFSKDILVYSCDEVDYWKDSVNHIIANGIREGTVLYERR